MEKKKKHNLASAWRVAMHTSANIYSPTFMQRATNEVELRKLNCLTVQPVLHTYSGVWALVCIYL